MMNIHELQDDVDQLITDVQAAQKKLRRLGDETNSLSQQVQHETQTASDRLSTVERRVDATQSRVDLHEPKVGSLETRLGDSEQVVRDLRHRADIVREDCATLMKATQRLRVLILLTLLVVIAAGAMLWRRIPAEAQSIVDRAVATEVAERLDSAMMRIDHTVLRVNDAVKEAQASAATIDKTVDLAQRAAASSLEAEGRVNSVFAGFLARLDTLGQPFAFPTEPIHRVAIYDNGATGTFAMEPMIVDRDGFVVITHHGPVETEGILLVRDARSDGEGFIRTHFGGHDSIIVPVPKGFSYVVQPTEEAQRLASHRGDDAHSGIPGAGAEIGEIRVWWIGLQWPTAEEDVLATKPS
jgi:prefoldin subunit 5